ncbi:MAG: hypothetical protein QOE05_156 [Actinomycetota bacterium]|jgi:RNA polymerase sigma factor (sigma-70 family)|nr:hypothetical protein [Actinomycetota bacterium]
MSTAPAWSLPERWDAVLEHRDRALRVARARLSDPYDVDDCVQEGMARVVAMPNLDLGTVGPLLSTVVANVAADTHRQHVRLSRLSTKVASSEVPVQAGDEPVCDAAEARWLRSQLDTLGERERAVLELRAEGRTVAETAAALGMTYKAVESAFTRARNALKTLWHATLALIGFVVGVTHRPSRRGTTAILLAAAASAAIVGMVTLPTTQDASPKRIPVVGAPGLAASSYSAASRATSAAPRQIKATPQRSSSAARDLRALRPPDVGPVHNSHWRVARERGEESLSQTVERCVREGITVTVEDIHCNG